MSSPSRSALPGCTGAYRPDIDGLRGIAILAVVGFHAFPQFVPGGFVGVDVFFCLSGYLITGIVLDALQRGSFTLGNFYVRRIRRIFPALGLVVLVTLLLGWFMLFSGEYRQLGKHTAFAGVFLSNVALWREAGYFDVASETKPLLHLWSLSIEEQFYLVWPLLLVIFARSGRRLLVLTCLLGLVSLALAVFFTDEYPAASFYLPHTRLWELLLGSGLSVAGRMCLQGRTRPLVSFAWMQNNHVRSCSSWLGLAMIVAAVFVFSGKQPYPGWRALVPTVGTALVVLAGGFSRVNTIFLSSRPLVFVGLISYPLYLWHCPLLAFARLASNDQVSYGTISALVAVSFFLAWLTYQFVEKPIRFSASATRGRRYAWGLVAMLGGCTLAGLGLYYLQGIPQRFPPVLQQLADYKYDHASAYRSGLCFIEKIEQLDRALDFSPLCVDTVPEQKTNAPLVALWGDSMAAHLYPGLVAEGRQYAFRVAQFTVATCPPVLGYRAAPLCAKINSFTAERLRAISPDVVVLAALDWSMDDVSQIRDTVAFLKAIKVSRIVIMGPAPRWSQPLPKLLMMAYRANPDVLPRRMSSGLSTGLKELDAQWQQVANELSVGYVSILGVMCDADGCLTRVGEGGGQLTAWDFSHFTSAGSRFLIERTMHDILPGVGK